MSFHEAHDLRFGGFDWAEGPVWVGDAGCRASPACGWTATATCGPRPGTGGIAEHPGGSLLGKILVPEIVSNVCFGGRAKHQLYITATTSLYMVALNRRGVQQP